MPLAELNGVDAGQPYQADGAVCAIVFVGFPGVGKTTFAQSHCGDGRWYGVEVRDFGVFEDLTVLSADAVDAFWEEYFGELEGLLTEWIVLLLPTHQVVLDWLSTRRVFRVVFTPEWECKEQWIQERFRSRTLPGVAHALEQDWGVVLHRCEVFAGLPFSSLFRLTVEEFLDSVSAVSALDALVLLTGADAVGTRSSVDALVSALAAL